MSEEKHNIVHPLNVCGCGTNHDAINAALRLARQTMRPQSQGGDCALWYYSVAVAYCTIAAQLIKAGTYNRAQSEGWDVSTANFHHQASSVVAERQSELDKKVVAGYFKADDINKDVSKFICEELEAGDAIRPLLEEGPSQELMEAMGFGVREMSINPGHAPTLDDILKFLFEGNEGSKAN